MTILALQLQSNHQKLMFMWPYECVSLNTENYYILVDNNSNATVWQDAMRVNVGIKTQYLQRKMEIRVPRSQLDSYKPQ